jgi:HEPN domain-containing protein
MVSTPWYDYIKMSYFNQYSNEIAPKIHSLPRLAHLSLTEENMSEDQLDFLYELDTFQLEGRYPLDRQEIYSRFSTNEFESILNRTEELIEWLNQKMT